MKKLIVAAVLVSVAAACRTTSGSVTTVTPGAAGSQTGAPDAMTALRGFLAAAQVQDLQGIGRYWGDKDGTATDRWPREEVEKREIIMAGCLRHDRYDVLSDAPAQNGGRAFVVNLVKPGKSAAINFDVVPAGDRRWYVQSFELEKLMADYCKR